MLLWPVVTLVGFVLLTGLVIAMGISTTGRYEREQRAAAMATARRDGPALSPVVSTAVEPVTVARAA